MSWALSWAGALGVIAAWSRPPVAPAKAIRTARANQPLAVTIALGNGRATVFLARAKAERVPIVIAAQGGPRRHLSPHWRMSSPPRNVRRGRKRRDPPEGGQSSSPGEHTDAARIAAWREEGAI